MHCKIKETLLIRELKPTLNDKVSGEKLYLCQFAASDMQICFSVSVIVIVNQLLIYDLNLVVTSVTNGHQTYETYETSS